MMSHKRSWHSISRSVLCRLYFISWVFLATNRKLSRIDYQTIHGKILFVRSREAFTLLKTSSKLSSLNDAIRGRVEKILPGVQVKLFEPKGTPHAKEMPVGTAKPRMTIARALFIKLMEQYARHAYRLTLLEIQKLAYFLQESGLDLRLRYVKHLYGPYAHNLNKVLEVLEGHYITGYGDTQQPDIEVELLPGARHHADAFLGQHPEALKKLEKVADLVDGFETPYGMELLASVHWLAAHDRVAVDADIAVAAMARWSERKSILFKPEHIRVAWDHLHSEGWINTYELRRL